MMTPEKYDQEVDRLISTIKRSSLKIDIEGLIEQYEAAKVASRDAHSWLLIVPADSPDYAGQLESIADLEESLRRGLAAFKNSPRGH